MNDLLQSIKADLTSRQMLPLLVLAVLGLIAAGGYALLGGSSPSAGAPAPRATSVSASVPPVEGPSVSGAPANPHAALAETTSGGWYQHGGKVHNPFKPLPTKEAPGGSGGQSATASGGGSSGSGGSAGNGSSGGSAAEGAPGGEGSAEGGEGSPGGGEGHPGTGEEIPRALTLYKVSATLTKLDEEGKPTGAPQTFTEMIPVRALPSKKKPLLAFLGVAKDRTDAVFLLVEPAILHGSAKCVPSPSDCEGIELAAHKGEELQYLEANGEVVAYELRVTEVKSFAGSEVGAAAKASKRGSKGAAELIAKLHLTDSTALLSAAGAATGPSPGSPE